MSASLAMAFPKRVFTSAGAALADMREAIAGSRQRIWLEVGGIADDQASRRLVRALRGRARAGVAVRLSCPRVQSVPVAMRRSLLAAGARLLVTPSAPGVFRRRGGCGRPLLVVDGRQAYLGAPWLVGAGGEERRATADAEQALSLRLDGALARKLEAWAFGDPGASAIAPVDAIHRPMDTLIASPAALRTRFDELAASARDRLWVSVPSGTLSAAAWSSVVRAARRGVDVQVAAPAARWFRGLSRHREAAHPRGVRVHPTAAGAGSQVVIADGGRVLVMPPPVAAGRTPGVPALASLDPALCDAVTAWFERRWERLPRLGTVMPRWAPGWSSLERDQRLPG